MRASASAIHCRRMPTSLRGRTPLVALTNPCGTTSSVRPTACPGHTETIGSGDTNGCVIGERGVVPGCRSSAKALWNSRHRADRPEVATAGPDFARQFERRGRRGVHRARVVVDDESQQPVLPRREGAEAHGDRRREAVLRLERVVEVQPQRGTQDDDRVADEQRQVLLAGVGERIDRPQGGVHEPQQRGERALVLTVGVRDAPADERVGQRTEMRVREHAARRSARERRSSRRVGPYCAAVAVGRRLHLADGDTVGIEELERPVQVVGEQVAAHRPHGLAGLLERAPPARSDRHRRSAAVARPGAVKRGGAATRSGRSGTVSVRALAALAASAGRLAPDPSRSTTWPKASTSRMRAGRRVPASTPVAPGIRLGRAVDRRFPPPGRVARRAASRARPRASPRARPCCAGRRRGLARSSASPGWRRRRPPPRSAGRASRARRRARRCCCRRGRRPRCRRALRRRSRPVRPAAAACAMPPVSSERPGDRDAGARRGVGDRRTRLVPCRSRRGSSRRRRRATGRPRRSSRGDAEPTRRRAE